MRILASLINTLTGRETYSNSSRVGPYSWHVNHQARTNMLYSSKPTAWTVEIYDFDVLNMLPRFTPFTPFTPFIRT